MRVQVRLYGTSEASASSAVGTILGAEQGGKSGQKRYFFAKSLIINGLIMLESAAIDAILGKARKCEERYAWLEAIRFYTKALDMVPERGSEQTGEIGERLGYAWYSFAMQAENVGQFRKRCAEAVECYEKARDSCNELDSPLTEGRLLRCKSMIAYLNYWLASELSERRRLIELCWGFAKEALNAFFEAGAGIEYGRTYNQLSVGAGFNFALQTDHGARETTVREAIEYGERAIALLSNSVNPWELSIAYVKTALFLGSLGQYFLDLYERERCTKTSLAYWLKATKICEEAAFAGLLNSVPEAPPQFWGIGTDTSVENLKKGLEYAKKTRDKFAIGCALDWLAFNLYWKATTCENPDEVSRLYREALEFAHDAKRQYLPISFTSSRDYSFPIDLADSIYRCVLSSNEVSIKRRRKLLEEAEKTAREGLARYENAGYPLSILTGRHELSKVLLLLARIEHESTRKRRLLEEALYHRTQAVKGLERFLPFHYFDQGFMIGFLVSTKCELAELVENNETKRSILEEAVIEKENSVKLGVKYISFYEKLGSVPLIVDVCRWQLEYASLLSRLYSLSKDKSFLQREVKALQSAAETFSKCDLMGRAAECLWKIAQTHETLGEELEAARDFDAASNYYSKAAGKIPQLNDFYQEKALYMQAWSEIEKAKHYHRNQNYGQARRHFEKAAGLHETLTHWRYMSPNYFALAKIEDAEELSRRERCGEAIRAFEHAAVLLRETRTSIKKKLGKIENDDEKQMAADLLKVTDRRYKYCVARISLENARILERKGEHFDSAREYDSAREVLESIAEALESEEDMREIKFIAALSGAWHKMMLAEDGDMPALYSEAAQLFDEASEHGSSDTARFLALGHSRFCRALEAGISFLDTQEMPTYSTAMQCLQGATRYYKMAGLKIGVEHAKATELLFEAYAHVNNAKREIDPEKKVKLYRMAEVILQASSGRYVKAKRPDKRDEVLRLLKTVREEEEWALSCVQMLRTSPLVSATYFPVPTPTSERAVGLNGLEHANVQAYLSAPKEAVVGDELSIRLDLINVAKSFGLLVRIDKLIPSGLKLVGLDPRLSIEDGSLDLRGRRLEPLRVESVKISAQVIQSGVITLSPKVIFVDAVGRFKVCKPKVVRVTVNPRRSFEFEVKSAEGVLDFLAASFLEDYEKRKMPLEHCGWRSLVAIMRQGKIPRSSVYRSGGGRGLAVAELERRGLIEARVSSGERGRGGNIVKLRVCYEKEDVKSYLDQRRTRRN
jgi:tetratricopeptide (TPR) repeat protein